MQFKKSPLHAKMTNGIGKKNKTEQTKRSQKSKMPKYNLHLLLKAPVTVSLIGENGFDTYFPGHIDVNLVPNNDYRLWVTAFIWASSVPCWLTVKNMTPTMMTAVLCLLNRKIFVPA